MLERLEAHTGPLRSVARKDERNFRVARQCFTGLSETFGTGKMSVDRFDGLRAFRRDHETVAQRRAVGAPCGDDGGGLLFAFGLSEAIAIGSK